MGAKLEDRFYNNHAFKDEEQSEKCEPEMAKASGREETPVTAFESSEEDKEKEEFAALKIQSAFRGHVAREEVKKMKSDKGEHEDAVEN